MNLKDLELLVKEGLEWNFEIDATRYTNGQRTTHNGEGIATQADVWSKYADGCSIRLPRPHRRLNHLCKMLSLLDEHFGSSAGANVYLTPAGTQGFAPHWDDIEAFILQTEGTKHWKVYEPRNEYEAMPRYSSRNMTEDEIGEPILECTLEAGDLLYFPRGFIHQAKSSRDTHSLHVTVSHGYRNSWYDVIKETLISALDVAVQHNVDMRRGLPRNFTHHMGTLNDEKASKKVREKFANQAIALATKVTEYLGEGCVDAAADLRAIGFIHDRLPPIIPNANDRLGNPDDDVEELLAPAREAEAEKVSLKTQFRLVRHNIARVKLEGDIAVLVHSVDNSRDFHGKEEQGIEFDVDYADALNAIIRSYPAYTRVKDVAHLEDDEDKLALVKVLVQNGVALTLPAKK
mmetsp:Transcript_31970/g.101929  ORF Transcript_31970/g.101929 Transcript_31970/m.101929 type:complete len:404 (-) Transcript_31970:191-1402(-)